MTRARLYRDLAAAGLVLILAVTEAAQVYLGFSLLGNPVPWRRAVSATAPSWIVLLVLLLPFLRLLDRFAGELHPRRLVLLGSGCVFFTTLHLLGSAFLFEIFSPFPMGFSEHFYRLASVYFVPDLLTFVAVVTLHDMVRRYRADRNREVEAANLMAEVAHARFRALRGQLRPDFFFNTLNAIAGLVVRGEAGRGVDALSALSALLRGSFSAESGREVTLDDEMDLVAGYLSIQELRFPNRLTARCEITEPAGRQHLPALFLVGLVEAVVDIGLERGRPFEVSVRAGLSEDGLRVVVGHSIPNLPPDVWRAADRRLGSMGRWVQLRAKKDGAEIVISFQRRPGPLDVMEETE